MGLTVFALTPPCTQLFSICLAWVTGRIHISFTFNLARADGASRVPELWNPCESLRDLANSLLHTAGLQIKRASWCGAGWLLLKLAQWSLGDTQTWGDIRGKLVAIYYREVRLQDIPETLATPEQRGSLRSHELALISSYIPDCLLNSLVRS